ncbi:MAG: hypothetical protein ACE5HA_06035 [Anaerolineae bacterium]
MLAITQIKSSHWYWIAGLAIVPLFIAGLFAATVTTQSWFRYDETYFAPDYQELYHSPGAVARQWEQALRSGDSTLVAELTGLGHVPRIEPNPNIILTILLEMDDAGYFHYLYFDIQTYKRSTFYIKEIKNRWVVVPADAFFYWDSGRWQGVFAPLAAVWWLVLIVAGAGISLSRVSAQAREAMLRD